MALQYPPGVAQPNPEGPPPPDQDGLFLYNALGAQAMGGTAALGQAHQPPEPPPDIEQKGDGTIKISNLGPLTAQYLQRLMQFGHQTQQTMGMIAQEAMKKREVMQAHPVITQIGRIASSVASQYAAPGSRGQNFVRGMGAFGADYFQDTPESLLAKAATAQEKQMGVEKGILDELQQQEQQGIELGYKARAEKRDIEGLEISRANLKRNIQDDFTRIHDQPAQKGVDTSEAFRVAAKSRPDLFTDADIEARATSLKLTAEAYNKEQDRDRAAATNEAITRANAIKRANADNLAAFRNDRMAQSWMGKVDKVDAELKKLEDGNIKAKGFFGMLAARFGQPEPTTVAEARVLLNAAIDPKNQGKVGMDLQKEAMENGYGNLAMMNTEDYMEELKQTRAGYNLRVPKEYRDIRDAPLRLKDIATLGGGLSPEYNDMLYKWIDKVGRNPTTLARLKEMTQMLLKGDMPAELQLPGEVVKERPDLGPVGTFGGAVEATGGAIKNFFIQQGQAAPQYFARDKDKKPSNLDPEGIRP